VSAGSVGFKNCKKSTAIAGQAVGLAMSDVSGFKKGLTRTLRFFNSLV